MPSPPPQPPEIKAAQPERKPSVWRPQPIPTPGPGRSTEDPRTPTLKELAARTARAALTEAQPASAGADAAQAAPPAPPGPAPLANTTASAACNGLGLNAPGEARAFADGVKRLQQDWAGLSTVAREDRFEDLINDRLRRAGVPDVALNPQPLQPGYNGFFVARRWEVQMNESVFAAPTLPDGAAATVADTAYHEARHAEQYYMMARLRAARGASASEVATALAVPARVGRAAASTPLPTMEVRPPVGGRAPADATAATARIVRPSPASRCAEAFDQSIYGAGAAARNTTLTNLRTQTAAVTTARQQLAGLQAAGAPAATIAQAQQALQAAQQVQNTTYWQGYRRLPEEADAWTTGSLVRAWWP